MKELEQLTVVESFQPLQGLVKEDISTSLKCKPDWITKEKPVMHFQNH